MDTLPPTAQRDNVELTRCFELTRIIRRRFYTWLLRIRDGLPADHNHLKLIKINKFFEMIILHVLDVFFGPKTPDSNEWLITRLDVELIF